MSLLLGGRALSGGAAASFPSLRRHQVSGVIESPWHVMNVASSLSTNTKSPIVAQGTLVVVEHDGRSQIAGATLSAVAAAGQLGAPVTALVAGHGVAQVADAASKVAGVSKASPRTFDVACGWAWTAGVLPP